MKIGIDQLHLYSSHYSGFENVATERGVDVDKFYRGIKSRWRYPHQMKMCDVKRECRPWISRCGRAG